MENAGEPVDSLAVYTTIYPGVEPFLWEWYRSLKAQTDREYRLWIGLDGISTKEVVQAIGEDPHPIWVTGEGGNTPAKIRQRALERIVETCDGVVLVDSDDLLHPTRVSAARKALLTSDLSACALRLIDKGGKDLKKIFGTPPGASPEDVLPRNNVFGFSNSTYRTGLLRKCLPIPEETVLVDWFLATKAWLYHARMTFDNVVRMDYRQHGRNTARVCPPFNAQQIIRDTDLVRMHFHLLREVLMGTDSTDRFTEIEHVSAEVEKFWRKVVLAPERLDRYVLALNMLEPSKIWWSSVAHLSLEYIWKANTGE